VLTDGGRGAFAEGVEETDGVGLAGELPDVGLVGPVEGGYLVVGGELAAGDLAAEDQGDDATGHVLVDASERVGFSEAALAAFVKAGRVPPVISVRRRVA